MAYAPPPFVPPASVANPTAVMGRRITAALFDLLLPTLIAAGIAAVVWFGNAEQLDKFAPGTPTSCSEARYNERQVRFDGDTTISCFEAGDSIWVASADDTRSAAGVGFLIWLFVPLNAFVIQGLTGATVGKHIMGLRVVRANGAVASFGYIALRSFMLLVAIGLNFLCFVGFIAELITASATKRHQRVGDMAAGTFVVGKASVGTPVDPYANSQVHAPGPTQWSAPPAGGSPYGAANPAPAAWGTQPSAAPVNDPASAPTDSAIPPTWGVQPDPGAVAPLPQAAPTPVAEQTAPAPAGGSDPTQPRWDEARKAYIAWEPSRGSWMQHDATTNEWKPI
jgi:RDD family